MNEKLTIPTPDKPFVKGNELFNREELKEIISFKGRLMDPEMIELSDKMKFALIYMHSMYGKASFGLRFDRDKLIQKTIKEANFPVLSDEELKVYCKLYNYAHAAYYKKNEEVTQFVGSTHMSVTIYEVFHFLIVEALYDITGVSFFEHIGELCDNPTNENLKFYYRKRTEAYDPIRNNMLLFYIRNQSQFDDVFLREMSDDYKSIEVMSYEYSLKD